ncbi:Aspartic proteinase nepenthesin-1 [Quillaja saponaria]|uniref:Aspartic proteinase nepenthesin-1 n=1 Tax=Quillaja saponaria TaxID=32244 RepID=A0AAD7PEE5_QUISA|nr:Aspartic proteinase nepenthesin-1 [Quillaja saponaria]
MSSSLFLLYFMLCFSYLSAVSSFEIVLLPLTHALSKTQFNSTHHLLKSASTRSTIRFHRHHHHQQHHQLSLPLSPGSDYTLSFTIGREHPQPISLYMDTGSDLVWFPCSPFECILCEGKPTTNSTPPKIPKTAAVTCKSSACSAAHSSHSSSDLCAIAQCPLELIETSDCSSFSCPPFYYAYGDGSLIARLYRDSLSLPMSSPSLILKNFTFGCAHTTLGEPIGVAGFGRGLLSMPAQLARFSPHLGNQFSYCLVSHSFNKDRVRRLSPLIIGRYDEEEMKFGNEAPEFVYTSMLENPKHPYFYCIGLVGISIGKKTIPAPEILKRVDNRGNGGMVVDSGTTFTMLPSSLYDSVVTEFDHRVGKFHERASGIEDKTGLSPCYYFDKLVEVPVMTLHFVGHKSSVVLPRNNYFYEFIDGGDGFGKKKKVGCLMLMNGGSEAELNGGPGATLGNYQQQGFEVVYDLEKRRVGFAKRQCATFWDNLNKN